MLEPRIARCKRVRCATQWHPAAASRLSCERSGRVALPPLRLRDRLLRAAEALCELLLGEAGTLTSVAQQVSCRLDFPAWEPAPPSPMSERLEPLPARGPDYLFEVRPDRLAYLLLLCLDARERSIS